MAKARVTELTSDAEWDAAVPVIRQLWTDADESFVRSWREEDDYHLLGLSATADPGPTDDPDPAESLVAVAGVSVQRVLHHARHAWVHDFVVREAERGQGYGAELLAAAEEWARERDCGYVALAVRDGNGEALSFYESTGMERWGHVVEREL